MVLAGIFYFFILKDYQRDRILTFFNPKRDPLGRGYQILQSIITVGSGRFLGRGIGLGTQSHLHFLPATKTDFIFSAISEETGFLGSFILIFVFFLLFYRLIKIIKGTYDTFGSLIVSGITIIILIQIILNIGMNLGLAPIIGIPLPFVSYGGSSLIINLISIGLVESIVSRRLSIS